MEGGTLVIQKSTFKHAILDGVVRGLLLYGLGEYITSQYSQYAYAHYLIAAAICAFISIFLSFLLSKKESRLAMFYGISQVFFVLFALLIFVNYMTIGVHVLPMRELGDADGLLIMLVQGVFLLISEHIRLVILFAVHIHRRINNSAN
jgi:hypothetical protein